MPACGATTARITRRDLLQQQLPASLCLDQIPPLFRCRPVFKPQNIFLRCKALSINLNCERWRYWTVAATSTWNSEADILGLRLSFLAFSKVYKARQDSSQVDSSNHAFPEEWSLQASLICQKILHYCQSKEIVTRNFFIQNMFPGFLVTTL